MAKSKITPEHKKFLEEQLEADFGPELQALEKQLNHDIMMSGKPSKLTMTKRDNLMKRILDKKHEREQEQ